MHSLLLVSHLAGPHFAAQAEAALASGADALVLDLAGAGDGEMGLATRQVCDFLRAAQPMARRPQLVMRIPVLDAPVGRGVLDHLIAAGADGILLPEAQGGNDVTRLDARISVEEAVHGIDHGHVKILAEAGATAHGVLGLASFRGASHRLTGLVWSAERLAADLGGIGVRMPDGTLRAPLSFALGQFLIAAAAARITAIYDGTGRGHAAPAAFAAARDDGFAAGLTDDTAEIAVIAEAMTAARG